MNTSSPSHAITVPGYTCTPLSSELVEAWSDLTRSTAQVDETVAPRFPETLAERLDSPTLDIAKDTWAVFSDGDLVAVGICSVADTPDDEGYLHLDLSLLVHPDHRYTPVSDWLLDQLEQRSLESADHRGTDGSRCWQTWGIGEGSWISALLDARGYRQVRRFDKMVLDLSEAPDDTVVKPRTDNVTVRAVDPDDETEVHDAHIDAFRDHWGEAPPTEAEWAEGWDSMGASPDTSTVAVDPDGRVLAYCLTGMYVPGELYLELVGVRREARGRGLAPAVLHHSIRAAVGRGDIGKITLHVDTTSPTGADGLYLKVGFRHGVVTSVMRKAVDA